jgi:hypothetical protein
MTGEYKYGYWRQPQKKMCTGDAHSLCIVDNCRSRLASGIPSILFRSVGGVHASDDGGRHKEEVSKSGLADALRQPTGTITSIFSSLLCNT